MNEQLNALLNDSLRNYRERQLKKALNSAQIALEFGLNEGAVNEDLVKANLILARIYNTNGRYQNEPSYFQKSLTHITEAKRLNDLSNNSKAGMEIALISGKVHLNVKDYIRAKSALSQSLELASIQGEVEGVVMSLCHLSAVEMDRENFEESVQFAERALEFLKEKVPSNHLDLWGAVYLHLSQAYLKKQDYSCSLKMSQELLLISRRARDVEKEIIALRNIAVVCGVKSNYKIGMQYFLEALDKCEGIGYRELYIQLQVNISTLYAHLYNYQEAIKRYQSVLKDHHDFMDEKTKVVVYNNLGNIYLTADRPEEALDHLRKAHVLADVNGYRNMQVHALAQLSRTKLQLNRLTEAKEDALFAQELIEELGEVDSRQINLLNLGEIAFRERNYLKAIELTNSSIKLAKLYSDDTCEIRGYKHLAQIYKAQGDFRKALEFQELYCKIQDSFAREQRTRQFTDMEIRHAIKEKQKAIEQLTNENNLQSLLLMKSDQIARQNQKLIEANEDLKQFAYVASHDLKEPLRMIGSFTNIIEKSITDIGEKEKNYFEFINNGVVRMNELLDGLLRYSTIGNIKNNTEEIDLNHLLKVCCTNLHLQINETGAEIQCGELPTISSNSQLLTQLFQNLLSNALKFTKPGHSPVVEIAEQPTKSGTTLYVKDQGIGISPKHQEEIFEIFKRLNPKEKYEGTGVGLSICQKIAKRLDCRLWVESEEGKGSTFFLFIPEATSYSVEI